MQPVENALTGAPARIADWTPKGFQADRARPRSNPIWKTI